MIASMGKTWKKGRGKLGFLQPLESRNAKGWRRFVEHHYRSA
jgi:hypothetical protein